MAGQETPVSKKRGPKPKGSIGVMVRMLPDQVALLDAWIAQQPQPMTRPEAIRAFLTAALRS